MVWSGHLKYGSSSESRESKWGKSLRTMEQDQVSKRENKGAHEFSLPWLPPKVEQLLPSAPDNYQGQRSHPSYWVIKKEIGPFSILLYKQNRSKCYSQGPPEREDYGPPGNQRPFCRLLGTQGVGKGRTREGQRHFLTGLSRNGCSTSNPIDTSSRQPEWQAGAIQPLSWCFQSVSSTLAL
jgi:hypothetical protein